MYTVILDPELPKHASARMWRSVQESPMVHINTLRCGQFVIYKTMLAVNMSVQSGIGSVRPADTHSILFPCKIRLAKFSLASFLIHPELEDEWET